MIELDVKSETFPPLLLEKFLVWNLAQLVTNVTHYAASWNMSLVRSISLLFLILHWLVLLKIVNHISIFLRLLFCAKQSLASLRSVLPKQQLVPFKLLKRRHILQLSPIFFPSYRLSRGILQVFESLLNLPLQHHVIVNLFHIDSFNKGENLLLFFSVLRRGMHRVWLILMLSERHWLNKLGHQLFNAAGFKQHLLSTFRVYLSALFRRHNEPGLCFWFLRWQRSNFLDQVIIQRSVVLNGLELLLFLLDSEFVTVLQIVPVLQTRVDWRELGFLFQNARHLFKVFFQLPLFRPDLLIFHFLSRVHQVIVVLP